MSSGITREKPIDGFEIFEKTIDEMVLVYKHNKKPWLIGYSGGKDSTLLVTLVFETLQRLKPHERTKKIYVVTSDTMVENPVVKTYMHSSSKKINDFSIKNNLNIEAKIIMPDIEKTFWSLVIGKGYPTPEPPGFRWCTERLKIIPMNSFVNNVIAQNGEVIILLGVRKSESASRSRSITSREIDGKILTPHNDIENAYVYNALANIENELVWEYLLKGDAQSPWGTDMKYLFSLYQGEAMGEEQSVIGEIDKDKIPVTGHSRFGCWCCTIVKEDKSLQNFINKGRKELTPLRDFRNWLVSIRQNPIYRDNKRRNGSVYLKSNGERGLGPFNMVARMEILKRLLALQKKTGFELITLDELRVIDNTWEEEGDLTRRALVDIYFDVYNKRLPWDKYRAPLYDEETVKTIKRTSDDNKIPFELVSKLILSIEKNKHYSKGDKVQKEFDRILSQDWLHVDNVKEAMSDDNK